MSIPPSVDPSKIEPIEFEVEKEVWEKYRLEDDTILHVRLTLGKFLRYDESGQPHYAFSPQTFITTYAPKKNRGKPSPEQPLSSNPSDHKVTPMDFERIGEEQWNIYKLSDGTMIRMRIEIGSVLKTDKFSNDGDPYYIVNYSPLMRAKVAVDLIKKPKK